MTVLELKEYLNKKIFDGYGEYAMEVLFEMKDMKKVKGGYALNLDTCDIMLSSKDEISEEDI